MRRELETTKAITLKMKERYDSGLTLEDVGKEFRMTRQAVRNRFVKAGIKCRGPRTVDKSRLIKLYCEDRLRLPDIAAEFRVTVIKVKEAMKNYNIPKREPLKLGGYMVDFLRNLEIGKTAILEPPPGVKHPRLHRTAKIMGIEIYCNDQKNGKYEVTRTA